MNRPAPAPDPDPALARVRSALDAQGFMRHVGATIDELAPGRVVLSVARRPELLQQHGLFHGGVIAFLVDNATTAAAGTLLDPTSAGCLTAGYTLNLVAPARGARLCCEATVVRAGRRLTVVSARVTDPDAPGDGPVAIAQATIANLDPATPAPGTPSDAQAARR